MDNFKIICKILRELEKNMRNEDFNIEIISAKNNCRTSKESGSYIFALFETYF